MKKPVYHHKTIQLLIERCMNGNTRAQFQIYRMYYKAMYNTCYRIVNNSGQAEDIMQESFLKAFTKIQDYRGNVSFGAWLKRIVVNHSIDQLRSQKNIFETIEEKHENIMEDIPSDTDEEELISGISPELIFREIDNLPDGYRIILSLYLIEGYSHNEISNILNVKASTSRSQFSRAKHKLLFNLKNKYYKDEKT